MPSAINIRLTRYSASVRVNSLHLPHSIPSLPISHRVVVIYLGSTIIIYMSV